MNITEHSLVERHHDRRDLVANVLNKRRLALFQSMTDAFGEKLSAEELDIHFTHMPARYWQRATDASVRRHLELIHEFFARLGASDHAGTSCIVHWYHVPDRGITTVEICTWDRLGLLAKVAGAFAAVGLNILRADIFTRADNVVLDVFEVSEPSDHHVRNEARFKQMAAVLAGALKPGGSLPHITATRLATTTVPEVGFDASRDNSQTAMTVEADDRVGLLYNIFTALARCDVNIAHAIITTNAGRAGDVFYLTDSFGREIRDTARFDHICALVIGALV
ncbi:MAG: ACT domain-containing protein [Verrucomicrobiota bacterium]